MTKIVGHLVDEERLPLAIGARIAHVALAQPPQLVRCDGGQPGRVVIDLPGDALDIVKLQGPLHLRVGRQYLLDERRAGAR